MKPCCGDNKHVPPVVRNERQPETRQSGKPKPIREKVAIARDADLFGSRSPSIKEELASMSPGQRFRTIVRRIKHRAAMIEGGATEFVLRYKPVEIKALHVEAVHFKSEDDQGPKRLQESAWIIEGPDDNLMYITEDQFRKWFEIVKED